MRIALSRILLACLFGIAVAVSAVAQDSSPEVARAFKLMMDKDYNGARAIVEPLARVGDKDALNMLGYLTQFGLGGPKDLQKAIDHYYQAAIAGSADSQFALGELAFLGDGVEIDQERAAGWYRLAAEQGHPGAQTRLGQMYAEGEGVARNPGEAFAFFRKAAEQNDAIGQYYLANAYFSGTGVSQNYREAATWYERAAAQGHADAAYNLALMHERKLGGRNDPAKAYELMKKAGGLGVAEAYVALGMMAHEGRTPAGDTAAVWFEKAAKEGDPQGQFLYAVALAEGDGIPANPRLALMWVDRALANEISMHDALRLNAEGLRAKLAQEIESGPALRQ